MLTRRNFTGFACSALSMLTGLGAAKALALSMATGAIPFDPLVIARAEWEAAMEKLIESQDLLHNLCAAAEKCAQARGYPGTYNACHSCRAAIEAAERQAAKVVEREIAAQRKWLAKMASVAALAGISSCAAVQHSAVAVLDGSIGAAKTRIGYLASSSIRYFSCRAFASSARPSVVRASVVTRAESLVQG
jgi:hypothetical protein